MLRPCIRKPPDSLTVTVKPFYLETTPRRPRIVSLGLPRSHRESRGTFQLARHWKLPTTADIWRNGPGAGRVGEHPVLAPGEAFEYTAAPPCRRRHASWWAATNGDQGRRRFFSGSAFRPFARQSRHQPVRLNWRPAGGSGPLDAPAPTDPFQQQNITFDAASFRRPVSFRNNFPGQPSSCSADPRGGHGSGSACPLGRRRPEPGARAARPPIASCALLPEFFHRLRRRSGCALQRKLLRKRMVTTRSWRSRHPLRIALRVTISRRSSVGARRLPARKTRCRHLELARARRVYAMHCRSRKR